MAGIFDWLFKSRIRKMEGIPGPPPSFPLGNISEFIGSEQVWEVCARLGQKYGGVTVLWMFGSPAVVLNDPEAIKSVLCTNTEDYYKDAPCKALRPVITRGSLFITNAPQWKAAREGDPLSLTGIDPWLATQFEPVRRVILEGVKSLIDRSKSKPIDLHDDIQRLSFDAFAMAFWGKVLPDEYYTWFRSLADMGNKRMTSALPLLPPLNPVFRLHRYHWYRNFTAMVADARAGKYDAGLSLLSDCVEKEIPLKNPDLAQSLATNFFGGVFSCSSTIITALYLLSKHETDRSKLLQALPDTNSYDSLMNCRPLDHVMREAMRYYPAVPLYFRNSSKTKEVELNGHVLPRNTLLFISNWFIHKVDHFWGDPNRFRPDRWANGFAEQNPIGSDYFFPFGRGPRMCIGADFAVFYIKLALACLYGEAEIHLDPSQPFEQSFYFGVMIPSDISATFTRPG